MAYTGFIEEYNSGTRLKADTSLEIDMWLESGASGIKLRSAEATPVFPAVSDVVTRGGAYGWAGEYTPTFTLMADPNGMVQDGVAWGAGSEFLGTLTTGGTAPATPTLKIVDSRNGTTAIATITQGNASAVNRVWIRPMGSLTPVLAGTRTGNGNLTITANKGEYLAMVTSTLGGVSFALGNSFWISKASWARSNLRDGPAYAHLQICKSLGLKVDLQLNIEGQEPISLWALDMSAQETATIHGGTTGVRHRTLEIPRQTGFPPTSIPIQSWIVIPSGSTTVEDRFGIDNLDAVADGAGIKSVFTLELSRLDLDIRLGS